jgi:hypothetical protein
VALNRRPRRGLAHRISQHPGIGSRVLASCGLLCSWSGEGHAPLLLCYRHDNQISVVIEPGASLIHAIDGSNRKGGLEMRTLTSYGIGVVVVFAILNAIAWRAGMPRLHELPVFSAGFILGMLGMYIAAWLYGYRRVT